MAVKVGGPGWKPVVLSRFCRSACRVNNDPARSMFTLGFRLAAVP